jgi:hypothetical protein
VRGAGGWAIADATAASTGGLRPLTYNADHMAVRPRSSAASGPASCAARPGRAPRSRGRAAVAATAVALLAMACASSRGLGDRFPYDRGQRVLVQGVVADGQGKALSDLQVVLEASRMGFGVYPPGERKREVVTGSTQTDRGGEFGLELGWNPRFNHFELVVGVPVVSRGAETLQELSRQDITRRVRQGSPVAVPVTLLDTKFLTNLRTFLADVESADEQRIYRETGKPDRVDRVKYPDRDETAWWYFAAGKVYRFRNGRLDKVEDFAPVRPL